MYQFFSFFSCDAQEAIANKSNDNNDPPNDDDNYDDVVIDCFSQQD
jgi:hypothetical protein